MVDTNPTAEAEFTLEARNLCAGYGQNMVLRDVTVQVRPGEFVSLIGANGGGKSTLFKCFSGHVRVRSGTLSMFGASIASAKPHRIVRAGLGEVPEGRQVFAGLSINDHLRLAAAYATGGRSVDTRASLARVHELFPLLKERGDQQAGTLSGGQQQMLVIGRALMGSPRALMLDEPSLGLAPLAVADIFRALKQLNNSGVSILLIEQNAMAALRMSDRAYVLESGRVVQTGTGVELAEDSDLISHYVGRAPTNKAG